jgi:porphobilinogen synthase
MTFPRTRLRRLRTSPAMRRLTAQTRLHPSELVLPMFVKHGASDPIPITSMPGVVLNSGDSLKAAVVAAAELGLGGVMLFGVPLTRDATGTGATDPDGVLNAALRAVVAEVGDALVVMADLCLDEFTDHGHCGVLAADGRVDNDATLARYAEMALAQAATGAHVLGLSGMMDGQVAAVRTALDDAGHTDTAVLAYAAKYASALYGPFRDAVDSALQGDRRTYQMDAANRREALREAAADIEEGAAIVRVKPAMGYRYSLADVAASSPVPVAAYQVSGEYAMVEAAAANGWIDRDAAIRESVLGIRRAGADLVLTYWAAELATRLQQEAGRG